jgi:hypothetical protein
MTDYTDKQLGRYALDYFLGKEDSKRTLRKVDILWFGLYDNSYLEEYTKPLMIRKLVSLAMQSRNKDHVWTLNMLEVNEKMEWFIDAYETNLYRRAKQVNIPELAETYLNTMERKYTLFLEGIERYFTERSKRTENEESTEPQRPETSNPNKKTMEAYSEDEINAKLKFYTDIWHHAGILESEFDIGAELNPYIYRILNSIVDGYEIEDIVSFAKLDMRCLLNQYQELFEIVDIGLKGIIEGEHPRTLERKLLFFIEEADRKSVSYFE